jgi:capsular polysaccharide biosynthesis protein
LGVPEEKVVTLAHDEQAECEELWLPTMPSPDRIIPPWLVTWWRSLLPIPAEVKGDVRLFLRRRGRRAPVDAEGLERRLAAWGFEAVDPADFERLRERLAGAASIVGVHGAGMTNLVWARPGARVLEIVPDTHTRPFYRGLAAAAGLDYGALVLPGGSGPDENFAVPAATLDQAVAGLLQEERRR